jgi:hypothetical protein
MLLPGVWWGGEPNQQLRTDRKLTYLLTYHERGKLKDQPVLEVDQEEKNTPALSQRPIQGSDIISLLTCLLI